MDWAKIEPETPFFQTVNKSKSYKFVGRTFFFAMKIAYLKVEMKF